MAGNLWTIPRGFVWDGASKPGWSGWLGFQRGDSRTFRASLEHDFGYSFHPVSRERIDANYYDASLEDGYPKSKARVEYFALRIGAKSHWKNDKDDIARLKVYVNLWKTRDDYYDLLKAYPYAVELL